jgi:magnesium transporter
MKLLMMELLDKHLLQQLQLLPEFFGHIQVQQNIDVRRITAWVALAAGPTMIAGIYGMNFENIPELGTEYGYFIILGVMVCLTGFLVRSFRKSGWL